MSLVTSEFQCYLLEADRPCDRRNSLFHPPRRRLAIAFLAALTLTTSFYGQNLAQAKSEGAVVSADTPDDLTLWYDKPATDWETQALPIGNGALGAMVFGGVDSEQIQFNEKSLWTGGPGAERLRLRQLDRPPAGRDRRGPGADRPRREDVPRGGGGQARPAQERLRRLPDLRRSLAGHARGPRRHRHRLPPGAGPARRGRQGRLHRGRGDLLPRVLRQPPRQRHRRPDLRRQGRQGLLHAAHLLAPQRQAGLGLARAASPSGARSPTTA